MESLWSDWDIPRRMMQVALWIKEKNEETGEWESTFWKMLEDVLSTMLTDWACKEVTRCTCGTKSDFGSRTKLLRAMNHWITWMIASNRR